MAGHTLLSYYKTLFGLVHHHKYSITDLENLMVYELDFYLDLLTDDSKRQEDAIQTKGGIPIS